MINSISIVTHLLPHLFLLYKQSFFFSLYAFYTFTTRAIFNGMSVCMNKEKWLTYFQQSFFLFNSLSIFIRFLKQTIAMEKEKKSQRRKKMEKEIVF